MRDKVRIGVIAAMAVMTAATAAACGNGSAASPASAELPPQQEIAGLFPIWNAALATGDAQKVADLYATDAVLLPTVSNQVRTNRAEIVDYFEHFLQNKPQGVIEKELIDVLDADTAINTGIYKFDLTKDGKPQEVTARYTYVYEKRDGKWLIANHHSSAMPEG